VAEHQQIDVWPACAHPRVSAGAGARLVDHSDPYAAQHVSCDFRQSCTQLVAVVVAVDAEYPSGSLLELVEQLGHHPVAGMNHHVGALHFGPYLLGQCAGTPRQMGVGDEQKTHGFSVPQRGAA